MHRFYESCFGCVSASCERCFECAEARIIKENYVYSLGLYFSRCKEEHKTSKWSQAISKLAEFANAVFGVFSICQPKRYKMDKLWRHAYSNKTKIKETAELQN